ncbi:MAG: hypothetical protein KC418_00800 [Anaerolineales bacterium]|nr:hypothetical protein [Anaerolineales bacterium]MCB8954745.1 hypothetical protein [Ardenticatenales bacterium]
MKTSFRNIVAVVIAGIWINASEFFRNEILLKTHWINHYESLGLIYPSAPQNGIVWVVWGFLFAIAIYLLSRRFNLWQTTLISWFMGFALMWIVTWNLGVLPPGILIYAIPLSLLEAFLGAYICIKMSRDSVAKS